MNRGMVIAGSLVLLGVLTAGGLYWQQDSASGGEPLPEVLPVPPFPPRIAQGDAYEHCLTLLTGDPGEAMVEAEAWRARGGGDAAVHCQALAEIASGRPEDGALLLEQLASASSAAELARASVLAQAVQARLMTNQPQFALDDATAALALSPDDVDLLINRGLAASDLGRLDEAVVDLTRALVLDGQRVDAWVLRARVLRRRNRLGQAERDIKRALTLDPGNAEALLERGILRQRRGDETGARDDWTRAQTLDPNSDAADLAQQNLALQEAGPSRR